MPARRDVAVGTILLVTGLGALLVVTGPPTPSGGPVPSIDLYGYSYPIFRTAQRALSQGHGLLWNDLQNSGQPFFAFVSTALLYPPNWLFLPFDARLWLVAQATLHFFVAGVAGYVLARQLGLARTSALGSALAFQLGGTSVGLATWSSVVQGSYVWMPAALLFTERLLRAPSRANGLGLGVVLTLQLFAGFPQVLAFTGEIVALRILYELSTKRIPIGPVLGASTFALLCFALLGAVQLLPASEAFNVSVRTLPMSEGAYTGLAGEATWEAFRRGIDSRLPSGGSVTGLFSVGAALLAGAALGSERGRRVILFYALTGILFIALIFDTPLRDAYRLLPVVGQLRDPYRFAWVTNFCLAVLVGFGIESLGTRRGRARISRVRTLTGAGLGLAGLFALSPTGLSLAEWGLAAALLLVARIPLPSDGMGAMRRAGLAMALASSLLWSDTRSFLGFLTSEAPLRASAAAFDYVSQRITSNERLLIRPHPPRGVVADLSLQAKTASLFGLPSVSDYEHLTSRRYAEYYAWMTTGRIPSGPASWIVASATTPRSRPMLNLLAARWLITGRSSRDAFPTLPAVFSDGTVRVLENESALPRAFYVPRAVVVEDDRARLVALASAAYDPRRVALLDAPPADGFLGSPSGRGEAVIERTESERLVVRIEASAEGFLFVSDQHYPGWRATVDGDRAAVLRANHAFRLVRVPAGSSIVSFEYRPLSHCVGAAVSLSGIVALAAWAVRVRLARRREEPDTA